MFSKLFCLKIKKIVESVLRLKSILSVVERLRMTIQLACLDFSTPLEVTAERLEVTAERFEVTAERFDLTLMGSM